jgi:type II secretory pathway pseudopilin PulG
MRLINSTPRSAKTLLEVVVILSIMTVVIGACATSLSTLFRLRHQFQRDREQIAAIARVGTLLRTDAHQAVSASVDNGCSLTLADGRTIRYEFSSPRIVRHVERDGQTLHRDSFLLSKTTNATFEREGDSPTSLIRLSIRPTESNLPPREIPRSATIEAAVGLSATLAQNVRQP